MLLIIVIIKLSCSLCIFLCPSELTNATSTHFYLNTTENYETETDITTRYVYDLTHMFIYPIMSLAIKKVVVQLHVLSYGAIERP